MAKGKKHKTGGKHRASPRHARVAATSRSYATDESDFAPAAASFSLRDAARTASDRRPGWSSQIGLRHAAVSFVRASEGLKGTLLDEPPPSQSTSQKQSAKASANVAAALTVSQAPTPNSPLPVNPESPASPPRAASPASSDSGGGVALFPESPSPSGETLAARGDKRMSQSPLDVLVGSAHEHHLESHHALSGLASASQKEPKSAFGEAASSLFYDADSDTMLADYMENLRAHGELEDDFIMQANQPPSSTHNSGWDTDNLADLDDLSTSNEVLETLDDVLSKRQRPSGLQYLVVWQGQSPDEARWIRRDCLTMDGADEMIAQFETRHLVMAKNRGRKVRDSTHTSSSGENEEGWFEDNDDDDDDEDTSGSEADSVDEEEMIARRIERMTDEQIARLLAKQEELGMGSEELVLFDAPGDELQQESKLDSDGDIFEPLMTRQVSGRGAARDKSRRSHGSAKGVWGSDDELFGGITDYGNFDPMDFDRPSLASKRSRSKKSGPTFDLSDAELETSLHNQWVADRDKKKAKKQAREDLRAQGLLGRKAEQGADLTARYKNGLSSDDVMLELEDFLSNSRESQAFPPMDKHSRKALHEVAAKFNLKSKSVGSGKKRFPVLYKTRRTLPFDEGLFNRVSRRFFPRMDMPGKGGRKSRGVSGRGGGGISYMDGDTVGASAPELGVENRGRAMLEKMGWNKGMSLGSLGSQGITEPIAHIVRKSRAGLG